MSQPIETRREGGKIAPDHVTGESQERRMMMDAPSQSVTTSANSEEKPTSPPISEDDVHRLRDELQQSLQEEERLTIAQMQLISQLEKINGSIISLEKEERMGKLAIQQAQIIRLLKKAQDPGNKEIDDEIITITPER